MTNEIGKIIRNALSDINKNQSWLAEKCNVSINAVSKWIRTGEISRKNIPVVANVLGLSIDQLLGVTNIPGNFNFKRVVANDHGDQAFIQIPMVMLRLSAGVTGFQTEPDHSDATIGMRRSWIERTGFKPGNLIAIHVKGDSMEPSLYEGDIVILNTADTQPIDGQVFAVNYEGEAVVKRLSRDAGDWWLTSDNPDQRKHPRKVCRGDACLIIGRVVYKESDRI